jgi:hypothetical protein
VLKNPLASVAGSSNASGARAALARRNSRDGASIAAPPATGTNAAVLKPSRAPGEGLAGIARHIIQRIAHARIMSEMESYDVTSNICQAS